ncbi:DUF6366 family protein [Lentilactobacillus hilgardii]|uniref:Uncharacterized protein n=1 Tax=Lentilactobacillus hilgardii TaxID=1588 RepID=A0A6P1E348_LENHI|nr:DUF6366 family protein [Lentilactobacillus hilgardii]EEI72211.1 hypothetical protein HMPREF0496_0657 [Lentilactobacillus hilgardii ATCC 27305]MCT3392439.1 hypothetical protein [Lentilactobacillus hilgardii]QHB51038.1 hypothetical protein GQR93_01775 [Lentilactobacillus hilgardii]RRG11793.1 MAG: hypothetical protein DUD35_04635 [Lactobacillus sp.]
MANNKKKIKNGSEHPMAIMVDFVQRAMIGNLGDQHHANTWVDTLILIFVLLVVLILMTIF